MARRAPGGRRLIAMLICASIFMAEAGNMVLAAFGQLSQLVAEEAGFGLGILLTMAGMALQWQLPRQRMSAEENMKDGKLTEEEAIRRIRLLNITAPAVTVAGMGVLIAVLLGFIH